MTLTTHQKKNIASLLPGKLLRYLYAFSKPKAIKVDELKLVISSGSNERTVQPEINLQDKKLAITYQFKNRGFYDVHLYHQQKIIATYTFEISK